MSSAPDAAALLNTAEAAELLGVSEETLRRWAKARQIRHVAMPSGQFRFHRADIDAVLEPVEPVESAAVS